jgi:hypothetical protein
MMNNEPINETPTARAIREGVERRLALRTRGELPAIVRRPPPKFRRNSVPHRSIR